MGQITTFLKFHPLARLTQSGFTSFKRFNETWFLCACVYGKRKKEGLSRAGKHETVRNKIGFVGWPWVSLTYLGLHMENKCCQKAANMQKGLCASKLACFLWPKSTASHKLLCFAYKCFTILIQPWKSLFRANHTLFSSSGWGTRLAGDQTCKCLRDAQLVEAVAGSSGALQWRGFASAEKPTGKEAGSWGARPSWGAHKKTYIAEKLN